MTQFYMIKDKKVYSGEYAINGNSITVYAGEESKSSQLNGMEPDSLAGMLLTHLIREGHAVAEHTVPIVVKNGLIVLQLTETSSDGSVSVTFLVSGPLGLLGVFNSRAEAEAYLEELLSEKEEVPKPSGGGMSM
jgi:hypothetical protein